MKKTIQVFVVSLILACLLLTILPRSVGATTVTLDEGRCWNQATEHSNGYSIASFDGYIYTVYVYGSRGGIVLNQSSDGGDTWEKKWEIPDPWDYTVWSVKVTVNSTGHVIVVSDDGSNADHQMHVWYSNGTGDLGTNDYTYVKYETLYNYEYVSVTVDNYDSLLIVGHDYYPSSATSNGLMKIYPNHTVDYEKSLFNLTTEPDASNWRTFYGMIGVGQDNRYYYGCSAYQNAEKAYWGILLYSDDNGSTWYNYSGGSVSIPLDRDNAKLVGCNYTSEFTDTSLGGNPLTFCISPSGEVYLGTMDKGDIDKVFIGRYNATSKAIEEKWNYTILYASEIWSAECYPIRADYNETISLYFSGEMLGVRNVMRFWKNTTGVYQSNITEQGVRDMNRVVPYCIPYNLQDNATGNESCVWVEYIGAGTSDVMYYNSPPLPSTVFDTSPPVFSNASPPNNSVRYRGYVNVTVNISDDSDIGQIYIWLDSMNKTGSATIYNNSLWLNLSGQSSGYYNVSVLAIDVGGYWSYENWTYQLVVNETIEEEIEPSALSSVQNILIDMLPFLLLLWILKRVFLLFDEEVKKK